MRTLITSLLLFLFMNPIASQNRLPDSAPGEGHAALARLAGNWQAHAWFWMSKDPSAAPMECTATVNAEMIMDGRFLFQKVKGRCMGQPIEAIGVIGHDNATGRYQAASFDNMGTSISRHVGERNDTGDIVLHLSYQDRATGATVNRRTVRRMISLNEWVETAHETRNGVEHKVMEIRAQRAKGRNPKRPN